MGAAVAVAGVLSSERCVAAEPFAAAVAAPFALPEGGVVFEGLQQLLAAALGWAAAVGADGHQHDRLTGLYQANAMLNQAAACVMAHATGVSQLLEMTFAHAGVMLQLKSLQLTAISCMSTHAADKQPLSSAADVTLSMELTMPLLEGAEWLKRLMEQFDPQVHQSRFSDLNQSKNSDHPPVKGGRKANSSPACTLCWGSTRFWLIATRRLELQGPRCS